MSESSLNQIIEQLREQMVQLAMEKGMRDQGVLAVSQQLDDYIVRLQRLMNEKHVNHIRLKQTSA